MRERSWYSGILVFWYSGTRTRWRRCSRRTHNNIDAFLESASQITTTTTTLSSYYARREQWLPTRLLVAPRSLNDELPLLCANNSLARPVLPLEILLETAGLDRKSRRFARSPPPPPKHPRVVALWNRKLLSGAPKARFPPRSHKSTGGAQDPKSKKQRGGL